MAEKKNDPRSQSIPRPLPSNLDKQWNPLRHESNKREPQKSSTLREPSLGGAIGGQPPPKTKIQWNPWAHVLPAGVTPPVSYQPVEIAPQTPGKGPSGENTLQVAKRLARLGTETAFDVLAKVKKLQADGRSIVSFALGEPDFETPIHIRDAAKKALDEGMTHYSPSAGIPALRQAIAAYISRSRKITVLPEQVVVGPGAKPILFDTMMALVDEGDEVIYPNPGYPIYESLADFLGAKAVPLPLREEHTFRLDLPTLEKLITPRTKVLFINTPANPTGGVLTSEDLAGVAELARKHNFWVIADEIYSEILYLPQFASLLQQPGIQDRTVVIDGFSKTFAMTGWRLGYGVMPEHLAIQVARIETNIDSCTCTFAQIAAVQALEGPWDEVHRFRQEFQNRRDAIVDGLNGIKGIKCLRPEGAFYAFPNVTAACRHLGLEDAREFQSKALTEAGVAVLARTCFGRKNPGEDQEYIRLSYATSLENIREGLKRLKAFCEK